jgi:hypothetical protein
MRLETENSNSNPNLKLKPTNPTKGVEGHEEAGDQRFVAKRTES